MTNMAKLPNRITRRWLSTPEGMDPPNTGVREIAQETLPLSNAKAWTAICDALRACGYPEARCLGACTTSRMARAAMATRHQQRRQWRRPISRRVT